MCPLTHSLTRAASSTSGAAACVHRQERGLPLHIQGEGGGALGQEEVRGGGRDVVVEEGHHLRVVWTDVCLGGGTRTDRLWLRREERSHKPPVPFEHSPSLPSLTHLAEAAGRADAVHCVQQQLLLRLALFLALINPFRGG